MEGIRRVRGNLGPYANHLYTLMQYETHFPGAYRYLIKKMTLDRLRLDTLAVIKQELVISDPRFTRIDEHVSNLTQAGRSCMTRALVKAERR